MNSGEMDFTNAEMLRRKAEEKLKTSQQKEKSIERETDLKRLVHELQVHHIELEMQNEELRHAYEIAEKALGKYTMLYDLSPMGYFTLDSEGTICDLNFTGAEILGEKRISLIDSSFKLFLSEDSKLAFNNFLRKVFTSNAKESCEVVLDYGEKPSGSFYMEGVVIEDDKKCLLSVIDISKFYFR